MDESSDECQNQNEPLEEPGDISDLFRWPQTYANTMLNNDENMLNFRNILKYNIQHHENFSGTGSAGIALHMVHTAFTRRLVALETSRTGQVLQELCCIEESKQSSSLGKQPLTD